MNIKKKYAKRQTHFKISLETFLLCSRNSEINDSESNSVNEITQIMILVIS